MATRRGGGPGCRPGGCASGGRAGHQWLTLLAVQPGAAAQPRPPPCPRAGSRVAAPVTRLPSRWHGGAAGLQAAVARQRGGRATQHAATARSHGPRSEAVVRACSRTQQAAAYGPYRTGGVATGLRPPCGTASGCCPACAGHAPRLLRLGWCGPPPPRRASRWCVRSGPRPPAARVPGLRCGQPAHGHQPVCAWLAPASHARSGAGQHSWPRPLGTSGRPPGARPLAPGPLRPRAVG